MSLSTKVFVYHSEDVCEASMLDLKEFFTSETIFATRPDVQLSDFNFNPTGLSTPTFVVPGGSAIMMGMDLQPKFAAIRNVIANDFNYVGSCAGAFIGTVMTDFYATSHETMRNGELAAPTYIFGSANLEFNLGIICDYKALGAFYPNASHNQSQAKQYMPYRVNLSLCDTHESLPQLYVAGPGFFKTNGVSFTDIKACYADRENYTFPEHQPEKIKNLAAIISKKPNGNSGGTFLSGPHFEACVPNSKFLTLFRSAGDTHLALPETEYNAFRAEQTDTHKKMESLVSQSLK